jgi:hypothetical protein
MPAKRNNPTPDKTKELLEKVKESGGRPTTPVSSELEKAAKLKSPQKRSGRTKDRASKIHV